METLTEYFKSIFYKHPAYCNGRLCDETGTCPICGNEFPVEQLLYNNICIICCDELLREK